MNEKGKAGSQNQSSPGVLKDSLPAGFETHFEDIAELPTGSIRPCPVIPDFRKPTDSSLPLVIQTPVDRFCIDGWGYIQHAKAQGYPTVRCFVTQIRTHSDVEIAIRKVANRTKPRGGTCSYPELVRDTTRLFDLIHQSTDDPVVFFHGGDRRGTGFSGRREENIRRVLARRLGKSQTTINKYLQHGEGLDETAMEALIDADASKMFFETFQAYKQAQLAQLKSAGAGQAAIVETISSLAVAWLRDDSRRPPLGQSHSGGSQPSPPAQSPVPDQNITGASPRHTHAPKPLQAPDEESPGAPSGPVPPNPEAIGLEIRRIGEALIEVGGGQHIAISQQIATVRNLIGALAVLLQRLVHIEAQGNGGEGGKL